MAKEISDRPEPARDGHAALDRRADLLRAVRDGDQRPRPRGDLAHRARRPGIVTDTSHTKARILDVRARPHHAGARAGDKIVLVAGFQGVSTAPAT